MTLIAPLPLTIILAFTDSCLLTFTFNPIHYCGPPSIHSAVRGEKSSAKYGCVFVLLDFLEPSPGDYAPLPHLLLLFCTRIDLPSPHQFRRAEKYLGLFIVSPLPWVEMAFRQDEVNEGHAFEGHAN